MLNDTDLQKTAMDSLDAGFDVGAEPSATAPPARFGRLALCVAAASALAFGVVGTVAYGIWFNHDQQAYADAMAGARQALGAAASAPMGGPALAQSIAPLGPVTFAAATRSAAMAAAGGAAAGMQATTAATPVTTGMQVTAGMPATARTQAVAELDGEEGGQQASWSGPVTQFSTPAGRETSVADATPAVAASSVPAAHRATAPSNPAAQQLASSRPGRDPRLAQQDHRSSSTANSRHKSSLFARMGSFFRRVSYRQHGTGSQQDIYSHP
ncbi:hypothetical protein [Paraburkholderia domus]|uniref:hypothetical protein n=1 Tax=Paraburkholderia domus TaxID=2793075 RepID=UPI001B26E61F|nr:hypothetical protein [Paraburkholderia domus]CAE6803695.1 hypothetical protein R75483_05462 [Paraburkholderia domus]